MKEIPSDNPESLVSVERVMAWNVSYTFDPSAPRITIDRVQNRVLVSGVHTPDEKARYRLGVLTVAQEVATLEAFRVNDPREASRMFANDPGFIRELLFLTGARMLAERNPDVARRIAQESPDARSAVAEFRSACAEFIATGAFPKMTEQVQVVIDSLPTSSKTGKHLLTTFTSDSVTFSRKLNYFNRFFTPAIEKLRQFDTDLRATDSENFQPSTDDNQEGPEISPEDIEQRIEPFVGGYFREKVLDAVDWRTMRVVATGVPSERLQATDESRSTTTPDKQHTFFGINGMALKDGELTLPLPASACILPESLSAELAIRQTINGTYALEYLGKGEPSKDYKFLFERREIPLAWIKASPTEAEQGIPEAVVTTLSLETREFLEGLRSARINDKSRVRHVAGRVQNGIEYVNDSEVGDTLTKAGKNYFAELEAVKKGDCDVSNFYALAQIRALGISCRMITGYHVKRNKRFAFAALAGTKHAWLEWWNKAMGLWERIDATPPAPPQEGDESEREGGSGGTDMFIGNADVEPTVAPDESDDDPWGMPYGKEEMARLRERLDEITGTTPEGNVSAEQISLTFESLYGVSSLRWDEVRQFAEKVARERIPRSATVERQADSTVGEEWKHILDLLLVAYRLPTRSRRTMGRASQGGVLTDPVSAGVDVLLGADDPYGYEVKKQREIVEELPIRFSNDFLLDVTASMEAENREGNSLLQLERKFVVSSLYEGYLLNERIKQRVAELSQVPVITNHVLSIHGGGKWQEIHKTGPMSLKSLTEVDDAFRKPVPGAGAMAEAIETYAKILEADPATLRALKEGEMVKTLTIISDGNLWCSSCGRESCSYELHGPSLARVKKALKSVRESGVIVNVIGFTEQSRPVMELFAVEGDPVATVVVEDLAEALVAHQTQVIRAMKPVLDEARKRGNITL